MKQFLYICLIIMSVLVACNDVPKSNTQKSNSSETVKNNRKNGVVKYYYDGGQLKSIVHYKDSLKCGVSITYYPSGEKQYEIPYKDGMKEGDVKWFYKSGQIYRVTPYKRGKKMGLRKYYWESGAIKAEVALKEDMFGTGLREFTKSGKQKKTPVIEVENIGKKANSEEYVLKFRLSDKSSKVEYYVGKLVEDRYLPKRLTRELRPVKSVNGVGTFTFSVPEGTLIHKKITIVADKTTSYRNHLIITKEYLISVRNAGQ